MKLKVIDLIQKRNILMTINMGINDRLTYAAQMLMDNMNSAFKPINKIYDKKIRDAQAKNAATDAVTGVFILDNEKGYTYKPDGVIILNDRMDQYNEEKEDLDVDVQPYFVGTFKTKGDGWDRLPNLPQYVVEKLSGLLFDPAVPLTLDAVPDKAIGSETISTEEAAPAPAAQIATEE